MEVNNLGVVFPRYSFNNYQSTLHLTPPFLISLPLRSLWETDSKDIKVLLSELETNDIFAT